LREAWLTRREARTIILPVDLDRYFPPVDAEYEAKHSPNSACRIVESIWGHMAPINPGDVSGFDPALAELLNG
jgi:homoserine O-acetyltransferase